LFYERGAFDSTATALTSFVSQMYCVGILFMTLCSIVVKVFYSFRNTITPLLVSIFVVGLNIIGNIILSRSMLAGGIALSTSLSQLIAFVIFYSMLSNYLKAKENDSAKNESNLLLEFILLVLATMPMIAIGMLLFPWALISSPFVLQALKLTCIALLLGVVFYFASAILKTKGHGIAKGYFIRGAKVIKNKMKIAKQDSKIE
jgi:putative peptidoglycan lipid II flippase